MVTLFPYKTSGTQCLFVCFLELIRTAVMFYGPQFLTALFTFPNNCLNTDSHCLIYYLSFLSWPEPKLFLTSFLSFYSFSVHVCSKVSFVFFLPHIKTEYTKWLNLWWWPPPPALPYRWVCIHHTNHFYCVGFLLLRELTIPIVISK